ncbi:MAG: GNAT family N-acetyltransferase [Candidatus Lokiarchaeota archaeon]|nr:GNAT family N-acetyltransferase [Candidatus Lokiarchaeota archaeon]
MIIREFSEGDIEEITLLMKQLCILKGKDFNEERWRKGLTERIFSDSQSKVIVAFDENNNPGVLGIAKCSVKSSGNGFKYGYVSNLIVLEDKRRTGIGELIMRNAIDYFKNNHIQSIRLALIPNLDKGAIILFTKLGFQDILHIYELKI